jgi:tRNA threonylcarbamoyladenosine biosynthesis protein TsaB
MMDEVKLQPEDIDQIVISEGPGSYTGVRIAMTIAKVFCAMRDLPLYTVGTLQLYAGMEKCRVVTDARGKRVYTCTYENGKATGTLEAVEIAALSIDSKETVIGDGALVGRADNWPDIVANFLALKNEWKKAENVHLVVPEYLKPSESYLVKKA